LQFAHYSGHFNYSCVLSLVKELPAQKRAAARRDLFTSGIAPGSTCGGVGAKAIISIKDVQE
jgi:hypothetical protein